MGRTMAVSCGPEKMKEKAARWRFGTGWAAGVCSWGWVQPPLGPGAPLEAFQKLVLMQKRAERQQRCQCLVTCPALLGPGLARCGRGGRRRLNPAEITGSLRACPARGRAAAPMGWLSASTEWFPKPKTEPRGRSSAWT